MATILPEDKKKPNAFGDNAAPAGFTQPVGAVAPAASGTPVGGMTPGIRYETQQPGMGALMRGAAEKQFQPAAPVAPAPPVDAQAASDRQAIGGVMGGVARTNDIAGAAILDAGMAVPRGALKLYDNTVVRGARAAGVNMAPTSPLLAVPGANPASMTPMLDRQFPTAAAAPAVAPAVVSSAQAATPAGAVRAPAGPAAVPVAQQADVRRVDNALAVPVAQPAAGQVGPDVAPVVNPAAAVAAGAPTAGVRPNPLGSAADTAAQTAALQASNASAASGAPTLSVIGPENFADRNAAFNEGAALRTAAAQGSWSPRRGFQGNDAAMAGALAPMATRARMNEATLQANTQQSIANTREAGETARGAVRERGDMARADIVDRRQAAAGAIASADLGLRQTAAGYDNRTKARIEEAQTEVQNAKTPEARRAATEKLGALTGKATQDNFVAVELGGGTEPIDPANPMLGSVTKPKTAAILNRATGAVQPMNNGAAAAPPPAARAAPPEAIARLKANPQEAALFDQRFGAGASARALGK